MHLRTCQPRDYERCKQLRCHKAYLLDEVLDADTKYLLPIRYKCMSRFVRTKALTDLALVRTVFAAVAEVCHIL